MCCMKNSVQIHIYAFVVAVCIILKDRKTPYVCNGEKNPVSANTVIVKNVGEYRIVALFGACAPLLEYRHTGS